MRRASLLVAFVLACADSSTRSALEPIQGGQGDDVDTSTVAVYDPTTTALGSGVLLAPNLVVTARHAVAAVLGGTQISCGTSSFGSTVDAGDMVVTTASPIDTQHLSTFVQVARIIVPDGASYCGNDIAILILSKNMNIAKYATPSLDPPMTDHSHYGYLESAVGYGEDGPSGGQGTRRIRANVPIQCIPHDPDPSHDCTKVIAGWQGYMAEGEFRTGDGVCPGDSGGPAYEQASLDAGTPIALGVLSRGGIVGTTCETGVYTRLDAWGDLVRQAALSAASLGGYAPPDWALPQPDAGPPPQDAGAPSNDASVAPDAGSQPPLASSGCSVSEGSGEDAWWIVLALALSRETRRRSAPRDRPGSRRARPAT